MSRIRIVLSQKGGGIGEMSGMSGFFFTLISTHTTQQQQQQTNTHYLPKKRI